jgi:hypothetical protein
MSSLSDWTHSVALKDPDKFVLFPKLPLELQRLVWKHARPEPHFIKLLWSPKSVRIYSPARIPSLLHACSESRQVALKWYQLSIPSLVPAFGDNAATYFDASVDGIYYQDYRSPDDDMIHPSTALLKVVMRDSSSLVTKLLWEGLLVEDP